jgi:L-alanine-DL-glutamate epimerase-like enolase superfamily enzyme
MIDYAGIGFVQIDTGRIGGITTAKVADYAHSRDIRFVNHTFTTHLALSASIQPYAGREKDTFCEYPFAPSALGREFTKTLMAPDANGNVSLPEKPGLGIEPDLEALQRFHRPVEIKIDDKVIFKTSPLQ